MSFHIFKTNSKTIVYTWFYMFQMTDLTSHSQFHYWCKWVCSLCNFFQFLVLSYLFFGLFELCHVTHWLMLELQAGHLLSCRTSYWRCCWFLEWGAVQPGLDVVQDGFILVSSHRILKFFEQIFNWAFIKIFCTFT